MCHRWTRSGEKTKQKNSNTVVFSRYAYPRELRFLTLLNPASKPWFKTKYRSLQHVSVPASSSFFHCFFFFSPALKLSLHILSIIIIPKLIVSVLLVAGFLSVIADLWNWNPVDGCCITIHDSLKWYQWFWSRMWYRYHFS